MSRPSKRGPLNELLDHIGELRTMVLDQIVRTGGSSLPPTDWHRLKAMISVGHRICAEGEAADAGRYRERFTLPDLPDFKS